MNSLVRLLIITIFFTSCGNPLGDGLGTFVDNGHLPGVPPETTSATTPPGLGFEFNPLSHTYTLTSGGSFKVSSVISSSTDKLVQPSVSGNYKVYSSVQGQFLSEESGQ
ncbi:MAG: hypothetical protein ACK4VO_11770 [Pseudobdellovibrio sp.]